MQINTDLMGRDLWLRTTDEAGAQTFSHHVVWDAERFMAARTAEAERLNEDKGSTKASAMQITRKQYDARSVS